MDDLVEIDANAGGAPAGELERQEKEIARLEGEVEELMKIVQNLERESEALDKAIKREKAKMFVLENPPRYLREMLGL